jgi:4'-phosphopantetheinyl transferase EntD
MPGVDELFERLGARVVTHGCVADAGLLEALTVEERRGIEHAVESRQNEFAGGRACAHASLVALGADEGPIVTAPDRSPVWPALTAGSISHTEGFCLAAASVQTGVSIGIDAEVVGRVTNEVVDVTMSVEERRWVAVSDRPDVMATAVFAVKEALYKAQHPVTGGWLGFTDVEVSQTANPDLLCIELVADVPSVRHLAWPLAACWTVIEPFPGRQLAVAAVVV